YEFSVIFDTSHLSGEEEILSFLVSAQRTVSPSSFIYGESVAASQFTKLEDFECHFQDLNFTLQVYNAGPSTLPGSFVAISIPNRLSATGADMFHIRQMMVS
ncbi:hypothetical protein Chor_008772, partial [Crotalus horridus]